MFATDDAVRFHGVSVVADSNGDVELVVILGHSDLCRVQQCNCRCACNFLSGVAGFAMNGLCSAMFLIGVLLVCSMVFQNL